MVPCSGFLPHKVVPDLDFIDQRLLGYIFYEALKIRQFVIQGIQRCSRKYQQFTVGGSDNALLRNNAAIEAIQDGAKPIFFDEELNDVVSLFAGRNDF